MMRHFHMDTEMPNKEKASSSFAIWAITPNGVLIGRSILADFPGSLLLHSEKLCDTVLDHDNIICFDSLAKELGRQFHRFSGHIFIFSTGIAVRLIAPFLESKATDPAVVVLDDNGRYVISLLSGHLGGANELARTVAGVIGATPVITTATDVNKVPAIDMIAKAHNLYIETIENIKFVNMAFLRRKPVQVEDPHNCILPYIPKNFVAVPTDAKPGCPAIYCGYRKKTVPRETLILRPKLLCVGVGCNRGTPRDVIQDFLFETLKTEHLSPDSIYRFATTDVKKDETGLSRLSESMGIQIDYYTKDQLNSVKTIENPSSMVQKHLGVKSVCEAAAILTATNGKLIVPKKKNRDVTIAVAIKQ